MQKQYLFILIFLFAQIPFLSGQESFQVVEQTDRQTHREMPADRAMVVFIASSPDYTILSGKDSIDDSGKWEKNGQGLYEFQIVLNISKGATKRVFTVYKSGTLSPETASGLFKQGEVHYYNIVKTKGSKIILTRQPKKEKPHLVENEARIELVTFIEGNLEIKSPPFLCYQIVKKQKITVNDKSLQGTDIFINTKCLDSIRKQYVNRGNNIKNKYLEEWRNITTFSVFFDNSDSASFEIGDIQQRDRWVYDVSYASEQAYSESKQKEQTIPTTTFFTVNGSYSFIPFWSCGFKVGQVKKMVGWYVSGMSNFNFKGAFHPFAEGEQYDITGKTKTTRISAIGGIVIRPAKPVAIHAGVGFGYFAQTFGTQTGEWHSLPKKTYLGVDVALGLAFHIKAFMLSVEAVTTNFKTVEMKAGIGFALPTPAKHRK